MIKKTLTTLVAGLCCMLAVAATKPQKLTSPDGTIVVTVDGFNWSVTADGEQVLAPSAISMTLADGTVYGGTAKLLKATKKSVNQTIEPAVYKRDIIVDNYNELTLSYKDFNLIFRAYDDGVAYRFVSKAKADFKVVSEEASFSFPADWNMYAAYANSKKDLEMQHSMSFENTYSVSTLSGWDKEKIAFLPLVVEAANGYKLCITESDLLNYPGMCLYNGDGDCTLSGDFAKYPDEIEQGGHNMLQGIIQTTRDYIAEAGAGEAFPWRTVIIAKSDKELANSDMVYKLATPCEDIDWSWIKPGKVAWDWWNDWNLYGVDFRAGINNDTYKYYIDFAASHGIEYVILDEGWAVNLEADLFQVIPEIDLKELADYAATKNVGLVLWAGYWAFNRDIEGVCRHFAEMGIKGFKIDFMDRDDQPMVQFYRKAAETAARYQMFCDFHGAFKPSGLQRTYPNAINFEGVHGLETMKWETEDRQIEYDVTIPFIRMAAGPMDYTQGAMRNATLENYRSVNSEPMSLGTRCHQLAMYVAYEAPFNMLCDSPSNYMSEPECTAFISAVPTTWDETIAIDGKIADYIVMARRKGDNWYVGALTDWTPRDMEISLDFLPEGSYVVEIFKDGINADRAARDYAKEEISVTNASKIKIHMAPGGGWVAKVAKQEN
ncbi:MAG: glycoside hydrolase family 97 protein [Bacteroidales bacterium]|nr:glycoside hydrolase family 97 protein [Candidatus Cryptobacteroides onthequi]